MQGIVKRYTITIETDDLGGYRAIIEDWYFRAGSGETVYDAILAALEYSQEWLEPESEDNE